MERHYVVTVTHRRRWWRRRTLHTLSGEIVVPPGRTEQEVFNRVCEAVIEQYRLNPKTACVLFYRLAPVPCAKLGA